MNYKLAFLLYSVVGKGPSIWDTVANKPGNTAFNHNGKIACDSYHKYKEDVQLIRAVGVRRLFQNVEEYKTNVFSQVKLFVY